MIRNADTLINIQFGNTYDGEKTRRLVEELRKLAKTLNAVIKVVNEPESSSSDVSEHVLATTTGLGSFHTVSDLEVGQVLKAVAADAALFSKLTFGEMYGVDPATFEAPEQGSYLQFIDGYYVMAAATFALASADYVIGTANLSLPNARIPTSTDTIELDVATAGILAANVKPASILAVHLDRAYSRTFMMMGA